ncbi:MAG: SpoIIE family protein phosphatase [Sulfitobacter sp.]
MQADRAKIDPDQTTSNPYTVLVVDDSRLQRRILTATLGKWGFKVQECSTAEEALALCEVEQPDIIISDWMMPGMSGIEFCQIFRESQQENYAYFILLTSKSEKAEVAQGLDSGADDFLIKPVNQNELRARITAGERIIAMQRELSQKNRLVNDTLDELRRVYDLVDKDLIEAKKLQQSLLPERHKVLPEGSLSLLLRSAGHVGGDLVGFFPTDDGQLGLFAIDVSGHGISSALMTARLAGYLSGVALDQNVSLAKQSDGSYHTRPPAEVVTKLNELVLGEMDTEHYLTLVLAFIDLSTGHVKMSQAGHPHPMIQRADGSVEFVGTGGFPVGLMEGMEFDEFDCTIRPGDRLILLSDGVTECEDPSQVMLEEEGLEKMMIKLKDIKGPALLEAMVWELANFAETEEFGDDVSGIAFEYSGPVQDK